MFFSVGECAIVAFGFGPVSVDSDFLTHGADISGKMARVRLHIAAERVLKEAIGLFGWKRSDS